MGTLIMPPAIPAITVGGRVLTDLSNLIILYGLALGTTTTNCSMRKAAGIAGYQVPASKSFKIAGVVVEMAYTTASPGFGISLLYSDNDVGVGTSTAFTNRVYMAGTQGAAAIASPGTTSVQRQEFALDFSIPTTKYPGFEIYNSAIVQAHVMVYGYEVAS